MLNTSGKAKVVLVFLVFVVIIGGVAAYLFMQGRMPFGGGTLTYEQAVSRLPKVLKRVSWTENIVQRRAQLQLAAAQNITDMLPDISKFPLMNQPQLTNNDVAVEIFASTEKSGSGTDGWMVEVAEAFNAADQSLSNGRHAKVLIRKIASGTAYEFISSRKYLPGGFSPSSHLWVQMAAAQGVKMTPIQEKIFGNIAGIVMKTSVAQQLKATYGTLDIKNIIDAVVQGKLAMGYTNPFASSTGLNFLFTVLATFAGGKENMMLDATVVSAFESFQRGVPFVSETTIQMRDSVEKGGSLDAFVMEYQTFSQTKVLQSGYEFIPFGVRHDNPLYAVGNLSADQLDVLKKFAAFAEQPKFQQIASTYGFNPPLDYASSFPTPSGDILIKAQQLWKQKKDAGKPISAVFVCDVSGSMNGSRLQALKKSLLGGSEFITPENSIGLVAFNDQVMVLLPIKKFDLTQKASFYAAVEDLTAGGQTAMYSGITVALSMLVAEKQKNPNTKATLFVLTDGETNSGLSLNDIRAVIQGLKIPIYTIGYEANLPVLQEVSSLVEAASMNADAEEVQYKIGSLLNSQM
jgi:Ca-activated chloride channel family protein